ncbi:MAG: 3-hydroxyacyl-CoA dehydrogenase family protein [Paracoccaceae bacterium]|nr:MAG: 3-hydroxyacyl-CoA dehydrogenase family protein [Paracoccaceae bacterium]
MSMAATPPAEAAQEPIPPGAPIGVLGAGLMGHAIAYLFARAGHEVRVHDPSPAAIAALPDRLAQIARLLGDGPAVAARVRAADSLEAAVAGAGCVIEAAPEDAGLKRELFARIEAAAPAGAILASNTSAIPIATIAGQLRSRARVVGMHFWNPPYLVPLVEVVQMAEENLPAVRRAMALLRAAGRHPVHVRRDIPGFIGNRLQHALKREAIALVAAGVCDAETIDDVVKLGFGRRMAVLGPMEQSDLVGLDLTRRIHEVLMPDLDRTPHPHPYLVALVEGGRLGMRTGQGFRSWTDEEAEAVRERLRRALLADIAAARG